MTARPTSLAKPVVHLSFLSPRLPGSYNQMLPHLVNLGRLEHQVISWGSADAGSLPPGVREVSGKDAHWQAHFMAKLPRAIRRRTGFRHESAERVLFADAVRHTLANQELSAVVCHDDYKTGQHLTQVVREATLRVFVQHGYSYGSAQRNLYSSGIDLAIFLTSESRRISGVPSTVRSCVVPNGVDTDLFRPPIGQEMSAARHQFGLPQTGTIVLVLGRLVARKGIGVLIDAWRTVIAERHDALLWLVGPVSASDKEAWAGRLRTDGLDESVIWQGSVTRALVPMCFRAADLFALPSIEEEGHPLALLEAMASGLACITADLAAVREHHRASVVAVKSPMDPAHLADAIARLLKDPNQRATRGALARGEVLAGFSLGCWVKAFEQCLIGAHEGRADVQRAERFGA